MAIGISHGALDNIKGARLLSLFKFNKIIFFYLGYVSLSILIILMWILFPNVILITFLILASYHFGKEDTIFLTKIKSIKKEFLFFMKGASIIISPLTFQKEKTLEIFEMLNFDFFEKIIISNDVLFISLFLSFLASIFLSWGKSLDFKIVIVMDFISIILLNYFLNPILAFTIYFCFLHSVRHSLTLIFDLDTDFQIGLAKFLKKAFPLTAITAILYLLSIYSLNNFFELSNAIYKVIFIGLASLTFPHILLEYLIEKNEK
tara:strand:+ start:562 stop:1347 length:786 start_codon:yes stop_codon:yes gene_type:complete